MPNLVPDAVEAWVCDHGRQLVLYARQFVDHHADAEDIVQEAFVRFWPQRDRVRQPVAYLYRSVRNTAQNWRRGRQRRDRHERSAFRPPLGGQAPDHLEAAERQRAIECALASLPGEHREIVVMKIWGGLSFESIGVALELSRSTVHARYREAMTMLESKLREVTI